MDDRRSVRSVPVTNVSIISSSSTVSFEPLNVVKADTSSLSCRRILAMKEHSKNTYYEYELCLALKTERIFKHSKQECAIDSSLFASEPCDAVHGSVPSEEEVDESNAFGESACGEPLVPHHLCLDFTPTEEDNDFVQRKCCDFWEYINSRRELQRLMVVPEMDQSNVRENTTNDIVPDSKPASSEKLEKPRTAVSMLQLVEQKGLIDRAFEAKMQRSRCSLVQQEYELGVKVEKTSCRCPGPCRTCLNASTSEAHTLCEELQAWDLQHPKSMEPPGQPPAFGENVV